MSLAFIMDEFILYGPLFAEIPAFEFSCAYTVIWR